MSEKTSKAERKALKELAAQGKDIPIAGCPSCNNGAWHVVLDAMPPAMTKIVAFVCTQCKGAMDVDIDLKKARGLELVEDERNEQCASCKC